MYRTIYESPFGPLVIIADKGYLVYCNWLHPECEHKLKSLEKQLIPDFIEKIDTQITNTTVIALNQYFRGERKTFDIPINFLGTTFQKTVWRKMCNIPYGSVITYRDLAILCGKPQAYRAVANACGANPIAVIVPCHRVVGANGKIGGYTGGTKKKQALILLESKGECANINKS